MQQEIDALKASKSGYQVSRSLVNTRLTESPFTEAILRTKRPRRFTLPAFVTFDGRTDPVEHIYQYQQKMTLDAENDALMCKIFPSSLSGPALLWFKQQPPRSIPNFEKLCDLFVAQYAGNQERKRTISSLFTMRQPKGEMM